MQREVFGIDGGRVLSPGNQKGNVRQVADQVIVLIHLLDFGPYVILYFLQLFLFIVLDEEPDFGQVVFLRAVLFLQLQHQLIIYDLTAVHVGVVQLEKWLILEHSLYVPLVHVQSCEEVHSLGRVVLGHL